MIEIIDGDFVGKSFKYDRQGFVVDGIHVLWEEVDDIDLVDAQIVKKSDSLLFGALGAVIGGPLGAAAGASIGGIGRPCTFFLRFSDKKLIATGWKMMFNQMVKFHKTKKLLNS